MSFHGILLEFSSMDNIFKNNMGKPFSAELAKIKNTISWASKCDVSELRAFFLSQPNISLITIGSGGSFSACHYASMLYKLNCSTSTPMTPFLLWNYFNLMKESKLIYISASGKNNDIVMGFKKGIEYNQVGISNLSMRLNNSLYNYAKDYPQILSCNYDFPEKKDGFLATNSLIAFFIILYKSFYEEKDILNKLTIYNGDEFALPDNIELSKIDNFIVLYGVYGEPVAYDIESKLSEAALGSTLLADYRNFGHGRHHWFDKKSSNSCILALVTEKDTLLAEKTINNLPKEIPIIYIRTSLSSPLASLDLLIKSFDFVKKLGEVRGIDPGRPGVPDYGSKLYHLNYLSLIKNKSDNISNQDIAILRKCRVKTLNSIEEKVYKKYKKLYESYIDTLNQTTFSMIAFDYDGTLCGSDINSRFRETIDSKLEKQLLTLLRNNIKIAVITGRGKSVNNVLRNFIPKEFWHLVYIGNYNGMIIYSLSDSENIDNIKKEELNPQLEILLNELKKRHISNFELKTEKRKDQLSIESKEKQIVYELCEEIIIDKRLSDIHVWISSHSMDIVVKSKVSKCNILDINKGKTLCIGDSGSFIGNDFELLSTKYSLSVDKVSLNPYTCWNISPQNISGIDATLYYLRSIKCIDSGSFKCSF